MSLYLHENTGGSTRVVPEKKVRGAICILIAEDNDAIRDFCAEALERTGYQVLAVENGRLAWNALQEKDYDLVITDNNMPEMTGLELIMKIRSVGNEVPLILTSGSLNPAGLRQNRSLHLACFLEKPFSLQDLIANVKRLMEPLAA